jgi:predicted GNAT family acetyltransferase
MQPEISDNPDLHQFEARVGQELAGYAAYRLPRGAIVFTHTLVQDAFEGQGVGSALARFALDDARSRGLSVVVTCPFIKGWLEQHPEYSDLVRRG